MKNLDNIYENFADKFAAQNNSDMSILSKHSLIQKFEKEIENKSFFDSYLTFYYLAVCAIPLAQVASAFSSYHFIDELVKIKIQNADFRIWIVVFILMGIELLKFFFAKITLQKVFAKNPKYNFFLISFSILISGSSAYFSIVGGGLYGQDKKAVAKTELNFDSKISKIKSEIDSIQLGDAYKMVVWIGNGQTKSIINKEGLALIQKKESEIDTLRAKEKSKIIEVNLLNEGYKKQYELFFGLIEAIFLLAVCFVWYFKRTSIVSKELQRELSKVEAPAIQDLSTSNDGAKKQSPTIGFEVPRFKRIQKPRNNFEVGLNKPKPLFEVGLQPISTKLQSKIQSEIQSIEVLKSDVQSKVEVNKSNIENDFEATLNKLSYKFQRTLLKHQKLVKYIFEQRKEDIPTTVILKYALENFKVSESTFYNILRILDNQIEK
jgi:hypothetical protein